VRQARSPLHGCARPLRRLFHCLKRATGERSSSFRALWHRTRPHRVYALRKAGFDAHGWGLGRNRGIKADILFRVGANITPLAAKGPVTLIGWSLGGLLAREYAKFAPDQVAKVITLGSPFSGSLRANNAWRIYELIAGHRVEAPPISTILSEKPPMETVALWSPRDGVVAPKSACGEPGEADRRIMLDCSHMAFVADPIAIRTIGNAIIS
jgi:pimeloyl-ACP methyl ester carboxylesterase